jgi:hypothetical protein
MQTSAGEVEKLVIWTLVLDGLRYGSSRRGVAWGQLGTASLSVRARAVGRAYK